MTDHTTSGAGDATGITITRIFPAPRELVFDAWTTPKHFSAWFGGPASEVPEESVTMDLRPGGVWTATMFAGPERQEIPWRGRFIEVDRPSRLVLTLSDIDVDPEAPNESEWVTVVFAEVEGGTQMVFHQGGGHLGEAEYERARAGWLTFFDALADVVGSPTA
jgi:uncharacterized protein YndB with AHSA1/START domain